MAYHLAFLACSTPLRVFFIPVPYFPGICAERSILNVIFPNVLGRSLSSLCEVPQHDLHRTSVMALYFELSRGDDYNINVTPYRVTLEIVRQEARLIGRTF